MKKRRNLALLILLALVLSSLASYSFAKYVMTAPAENTVTFTARLAESMEIKASNEVLIPGHDFDMATAPQVEITGKTEIPAYLYVEIVDTLDSADGTKLVQYTLANGWTKTTERAAAQGGTVYKYATALTDENVTGPIEILTGHIVVSQYVKCKNTNDDPDGLKFYATLVEVTN